jgi:predicted TIM-barrel fold metal-dependent hydrolase
MSHLSDGSRAILGENAAKLFRLDPKRYARR